MTTHQIEPAGRAAPAPSGAAPAPVRTHTLSVAVSAALVALMVGTGFAMLAIVPLALVVRGAARDHGLGVLQPWVAVLTGAYATPLVLWAALPGRDQSLSRDMHPAFVPVITLAALAVLARLVVARHRARTETNEEN